MDQLCFSTLEILQWTEEPGPSSEDLSVLVREMHAPKTNNCICRVVVKALEKNQVGSRDTKIGQGLCYTGLPR